MTANTRHSPVASFRHRRTARGSSRGAARFFDCYFDENALEESAGNYAIHSATGASPARLYNCTFAGGDQTSVRGSSACYNCLFLCSTIGGTSETVLSSFYSCAFASRPTGNSNYWVADENCLVQNASKFPIDPEGRPLKGSECIDVGSNLCYTAAYPFPVGEYIDLCGTNRIWNARIDIGCCEYIPPPRRGFTVMFR